MSKHFHSEFLNSPPPKKKNFVPFPGIFKISSDVDVDGRKKRPVANLINILRSSITTMT